MAPARLRHGLNLMLQAEEEAFDVDVENPLVIGLAIVEQRGIVVEAGAIGRIIEPAIGRQGPADRVRDLGAVPDIHRQENALAAGLVHEIEGLLAFLRPACRCNHPRPGAGEGDGGRPTDARGGPRDKDDLAGKIGHGGWVPTPFIPHNRYHMPASLAIRRAAWTRIS